MTFTVPPVKAVIFDLDGTLVDHESAVRLALGGWLSSLSVALTDDLLAFWFEAEDRTVAAFVRGEVSLQQQQRQLVQEMLARIGRPARDAAERDALYERYVDLYDHELRLFDEVGPVLELVRQRGLRTAVLTNGTEHHQREKLQAMGIADHVGPVLTSEDIGYSKPDAHAFMAACAAIDVAPGVAVFVGDDYEADIVGARGAGLRPVHLDREGRSLDTAADRISTLNDLIAYL